MLRVGEKGWQHRRCAVCDIKRELGQRTPREVSFPTWCPPITPGGSAFLPHGERVVAFPHGDGEVVLERRDARDRCLAVLGVFPAGGQLSASPDGFWVAYHRCGEMPHLYSSMDRRWIPCEMHASSLVFAPTGDRLAVRLQHERWRFLRYAGGRWWGVGDGGTLPQLGWSADGNEALTTNGREFARWRWSRLNVTEGGHYVQHGTDSFSQRPQGPRRRYLGLFGGPHPGFWHWLTRHGITRVSLVGNEPQRRAFRPIDLEGLSRQSFTLSSNQRWLAYKQNRCILLEDLYTLHRVGVLEPRLAHDIHDLSFADDDRLLVVNGHKVIPWYRLLWMNSDR
jgi:hypothetical protein